MPELTLSAESKIVEWDATRADQLTDYDVSEYSIRNHLTKRLNAQGYFIRIISQDEGWPDYEKLQRPSVYLWVGESEDTGVELGSDGSRYIVAVQVFAKSDAERSRLAELIKTVFKRTIPIYNYVTGNEPDPEPTGEYFLTDSVGWNKIPHIYNAPDAERWRAVVNAVLRRAE
jgi:hypothetical protein